MMWTLQASVVGDVDKPVVVLLHSLGSSHVMWDEVVELLVPQMRVVLLDLPGHGGSAPAPLDGPLTVDVLLDAVERTLDELGVGRFHFAGLSIGGLVTYAVAQRWGVGLEPRLLSASAMASGPKNGSPEMWVERAAFVREKGTAALVDATMERWFSPGFAAAHPESVARIREAFVGCADEGYAQCCELLETADVRSGLADVVVPFAVVNGSEDAAFGDQESSAVRAMLVNAVWASVTHVEGARHMCAMEDPQRVAGVIAAVVAQGECA